MGLIEGLRQEAELKELEQQAQQAKLAEIEVFHKQRKEQAAAFQAESGVGNLVPTVFDLLKKAKFPDAIYIICPVTQKQKTEEVDSVFNGIYWNIDHNEYSTKAYDYVCIATRFSGEIIFYARESILIPEIRWRNDKDILELSLERALNSPGQTYKARKLFPDEALEQRLREIRSTGGDTSWATTRIQH